MARIYFDSNIYGQLEEESTWRSIRRALIEDGHRVVVGDAIIGEAVQLTDGSHRRRLIQCICGLRNEWTPGVPGESMITEAYRLVRRSHPDWILSDHRDHVLRRLRADRKRALAGIASNVPQQELWSRNLATMFQAQSESIREWQKLAVAELKAASYRQVMEKRLPNDVQLPAELSDPELQWRLLAAERFYTVTNGLSSEPVNYMVDLRRGLSVSDWANFWLNVPLAGAPATAIHGLVRYFQLFRSLKGTGNMIDAMQATASLGCEFFVTSDRGLYLTMREVQGAMSGMSPTSRYIRSGAIAPASQGQLSLS